MKKIKIPNSIKIVGTSLIVGFLVLYLRPRPEQICLAVDYFVSNTSDGQDFISFIKHTGLAILLWTIGFLIWSTSKVKKYVNLILYFIILSIGSMSGIIYNSINTPRIFPVLALNICNKATGDYSDITFKNLEFHEYQFLNARDEWMPNIPRNANSINIDYYHDSFIGDFDLTIDFKLPPGEELDSLEFSGWDKVGDSYRFNEFKQ